MSRKIAFAGVFACVSVVLLFISAVMPTGKLTLYFLASLPVAFTIIESGAGAGITLYFVVCILSALVSGNIFGIIPFMIFFGHYPIFKFYIEKKRKVLVEVLLKLGVFNLSMLFWYLLYKGLFIAAIPVQFAGNSILAAALIAAMQVVFFIYDYVFSKLLFYYESKLGLIKR